MRRTPLLSFVVVLLASCPGLTMAQPRLAVLFNPSDPGEAVWWRAATPGRVGPVHTAVSGALAGRDLVVVGPVEPGELAVTVPTGLPDSVRLVALARRAGATVALVGRERSQPLGSLSPLGLAGMETTLSARLDDAAGTPLGSVEATGRGFSETAAAARQQALAQAAGRLADWVRGRLPAVDGSAAATGGLLLRVRGARRTEDLRRIASLLAEQGAGSFWLSGASPGEAQLTGRDDGRGYVPTITTLEAATFADFRATAQLAKGSLVVELQPLPPPLPETAPPGGLPASPGQFGR